MSDRKPKVFLRADGNSTIGVGHVYRLLALKSMLENDFDCTFMIREPANKLLTHIRNYCDHVTIFHGSDEDEEIRTMQEKLPFDSILVLDGIGFSKAYQNKVRGLVRNLVVVDDLANIFFDADLVINHGNREIKKAYKSTPGTRLLCGLEYLLLRNEFRALAKQPRQVDSISCLFICFGGTDPMNLTFCTLQMAMGLDFVKRIIVVTGPSYQHHDEMLNAVNAISEKEIAYHHNVTSDVMISLVQQSQLAITPSSTISLELCCIKIGLIIGWFVDNQIHIHDELVGCNCALSAGNFNEMTAESLQALLLKLNNTALVNEMMLNQRQAIDGGSHERLLMEFKALAL